MARDAKSTAEHALPLPRLRGGVLAAGRWGAWGLAVLFLGFIAVNSLLSTSVFGEPIRRETVLYQADPVWLWLLLAAGLLALTGLALHRGWLAAAPLPVLQKLLFCYTMVFGVVWVCMARSQPVSDAESVLQHANEFIAGDYASLLPGGYLGGYPHQLGLVLYFEVICRVMGEYNYPFIQLLNVLWVSLAYQLLVGITKQMFPGRNDIAVTACILLFFCLPPLFYATFVYGVLPGLCCALAAVWCALHWLERRRWPALAGTVLCCAAASLFKNNYILFAAGIFVLLLLDWLQNGGWKTLACLVVLPAVALNASAPVNAYYAARSGVDIGGGMPRILWVAMSFRESPRAPGWYNELNLYLYEQSGYDADKAAEAGWDLLDHAMKDFAADPGYAADFLYKKAVSQWNEPSFAGVWVSRVARHDRPVGRFAASLYNPEGLAHGAAHGLMNFYHLMVFGLALWFLLQSRKKLTLPQLLPAIMLCGGFVFHMVWEAKSQYTLPYFVFLVPLAAAGLCGAGQAVPGLWQRIKRR